MYHNNQINDQVLRNQWQEGSSNDGQRKGQAKTFPTGNQTSGQSGCRSLYASRKGAEEAQKRAQVACLLGTLVQQR